MGNYNEVTSVDFKNKLLEIVAILLLDRPKSIKLQRNQIFDIIGYSVNVRTALKYGTSETTITISLYNPFWQVLYTESTLKTEELMDYTEKKLEEFVDWELDKIFKQLPDTLLAKKLYGNY